MPPRSVSASRSPARPAPPPAAVPSPLPPPAPKVHGARGEFQPAYVTRKRLTTSELLTAAGAAVGVALGVFYFTSVWLERTPVLPTPKAPPGPDGVTEGTMHRTVTPQRAAP